MQPKPSALPGSLSVASSTVRLPRLPVRVHRACGAEGQCLESCSCLDSASWKPVPASDWNGVCTESYGDAASSAVAVYLYLTSSFCDIHFKVKSMKIAQMFFEDHVAPSKSAI